MVGIAVTDMVLWLQGQKVIDFFDTQIKPEKKGLYPLYIDPETGRFKSSKL
jgi:hypothetical protein